MTKVLMFGWEYPPFLAGGLGIATKNLVEGLASNGVYIDLVLPHYPNIETNQYLKYYDVLNSNELNSYYVPTDIAPYSLSISNLRLSSQKFLNLYGNNFLDSVEKYSNFAFKIAQKNNYDLIHVHDWMTAQAGLIAKTMIKRPLIFHVHATEFDRTGGSPNDLILEREKECMNVADRIIAVSEYTKNTIISNYSIDPNKIDVVYNSINSRKKHKVLRNSINSTDKIVLFLGRMTYQKNPSVMLEALEKVLRHTKRVKFVFAGDGDMLDYLINKSIEMGVEDKVVFTGFMDHSDVDKLYSMADVFVMPSISEPFGLTAIEAISNGTPVIMSKQSGVSEIIKNALKIDFWDVDELANQILGIIRYKPLAKHIATTAQKELLNHNLHNYSKKIIDIYNNLKNHGK